MIKLDGSLHGGTVVIPTNDREIPGSTPGRYNLQIKITSYTNMYITSSASIETETLQLKATRGGDHLSCSTDINNDALCAQQGALTTIAVKSSAYNR